MTFVECKKQQITIDVVVVADWVVNQNVFLNDVESLLYQDCMSSPHTFTLTEDIESEKQHHISINKGIELSKYYHRQPWQLPTLVSSSYTLS